MTGATNMVAALIGVLVGLIIAHLLAAYGCFEDSGREQP